VEQIYRTLVDSALHGLLVFQDGRLVFANATTADLLGRSREELLALDPAEVAELIHPEDREALFSRASAELSGKDVAPLNELRLVSSSGETRWIHAVSVVSDFQGRPAVYVSLTDVTARKRAAEALRESETRYRSFVQNFQGIAFQGTRDFAPIFFHGAVEEITGYTEDDFLAGKLRWDKVIHPEDRRRLAEEGTFDEVYEQAGRSVEREYRIVRRDGEVRWVRESIQALPDAEGRLELVQGTIVDTTERRRARLALEENERFLQAVFDGIQDGISVLDGELTILRVNAWMNEMYAARRPLVGRKCYEVYQRRAEPCPWCPSMRVMETGKAETALVPYPTEQDPTGWIELSSYPLRDAEGRVTGLVEHVKDISEKRSAEEALRKSEENYRTIFNAVSDMIFLHDAETGTILDANEAAVRQLGYSRSEFQGMGVAGFSSAEPPHSREDVMAWLAKARTEGPQLVEWQARRKDGSPMWAEVNLRTASVGGKERILAVVRDITERRRAEEERKRYAERLEAEVAERTRTIRVSEERHRALFENVDHAVVTTDLEGRVIDCNSATERLFGRKREEISGLVVYEALCAGEHREDFRQILSGVLRSGTATQECAARRAAGEEFPANVSVSTVRDSSGRPEGMIWILTDLSERERLTEQASRAQEYAEMVLRSYGAYGELVGRGPVFKRIIQFVHDAARAPSAVLITGESGTGKEAVARSIHGYSDRSTSPFVVVDCAALKGSLLESELFGHERGAFTGAHEAKRGLVEVADGGTLFLDEIGEMPVSLQAKLLRVLERGEFRRVGSVSNRQAAIRVIAATNRDLSEATRRGEFRNDLFFRLNVLSFRIPPLREHSEDVHLLANHFLLHTRVTFTGRKRLRPDTLRRLEAYGWPGNVRELANVVERAIILSGDNEVIKPEHLPPEVRTASSSGKESPPGAPVRSIADAEKEAIRAALQSTGGNRTRAAQLLGISTVTLRQKIRKYGITVPKRR
jgi:PAS domain S-box-containing protein